MRIWNCPTLSDAACQTDGIQIVRADLAPGTGNPSSVSIVKTFNSAYSRRLAILGVSETEIAIIEAK